MSAYTKVGTRYTFGTVTWSQRVIVDGVEYVVGVKRGDAVRRVFAKGWGCKRYGVVREYQSGRELLNVRVRSGVGIPKLLRLAKLIA